MQILPFRLLLSLAGLLAVQIVLYFGCEIFQKRMHDVERPIDAKIPFVEASVLVYVLWFPLIVLFPLCLYMAKPQTYAVYYSAMAAEILLSVLCYILYPTTFTRPKTSSTWAGRLMQLVYAGSYRGLNCAPSLHCSSCYLTIYCAVTCGALPMWIRLLAIAVAAGIVVSTMTTKQHTVIDAATALPVAIVCIVLGHCFPAQSLLTWIRG